MRIVVPYTELARETLAALHEVRRDFDFVAMEDDEHYWRLLRDIWDTKQTTMIIEQDIVVTPQVVYDMECCAHMWCASPYPYKDNTYAGLGCVRFKGTLMAKLPDLMQEVASWSNDNHPRKHWCTLDNWIGLCLRRHGYDQHLHAPVGHTHRGITHACEPSTMATPL